MKEQFYDQLLNINTGIGQKKLNNSFHYYPYEPTPYRNLEVLFNEYEVKKNDRIVDFGSGRGRLVFYVHYYFNVKVTGIEMNQILYHDAEENLIHYFQKYSKNKDSIHFQNCFAEQYDIDPSDNRFYFFNPFSSQIFRKVIANILLSLEKLRREIELILYYPSDDYIFLLENETLFELKQEIIIPGLYDRNPNERFLIYRYCP